MGVTLRGFYKYAVFYAIPKDFIAPVPFYPTQTLDLSYNETTSDLIVTFDYDRIVYPLLINLDRYRIFPLLSSKPGFSLPAGP